MQIYFKGAYNGAMWGFMGKAGGAEGTELVPLTFTLYIPNVGLFILKNYSEGCLLPVTETKL